MLPSITLLNPSIEEIRDGWHKINGLTESLAVFEPVFASIKMWPFGQVGCTWYKTHRYTISWERKHTICHVTIKEESSC
jgi:hypothetical protein